MTAFMDSHESGGAGKLFGMILPFFGMILPSVSVLYRGWRKSSDDAVDPAYIRKKRYILSVPEASIG